MQIDDAYVGGERNGGKRGRGSENKQPFLIAVETNAAFPLCHDIWATSDLVGLVKQRIEITDGALQAAFVVSRIIKGTRIGGEIREALADYELPVLDACITQRVSYPGTASIGVTVLDADPDGDAAAEVRALAAEVRALLA